MNLFKKPKTDTITPPSIDEARARVERMRRGASLRRRAANMLMSGRGTAPTAQRTVTGI